MTHEFTLHPDLKLLKKYKYLKLTNAQLERLTSEGSQIILGIPAVATTQKGMKQERIEMDRQFDNIKTKYPLKDVYDTLLYICLYQAGEYLSNVILQFEGQINGLAIKQLASFIFALENWHDIKTITIKSIEKDKQITVDHPELIQWLPQKLTKGIYNPGVFIQGTKSQISDFNQKNWESLQFNPLTFANVKGKNQAIFIQQILNFIRNETNISIKKNAKLYKCESEFIYEIGRALHVLGEARNIYSADSFIRSILKYHKTALHIY